MATLLAHCLLLASLLCGNFFAAATQACYYPNGDISLEDVPCGDSGAGICCPLNWQCMTDGLCYLANEDYYERHSCVDASWPSLSCPRICTAGMSEGFVWSCAL